MVKLSVFLGLLRIKQWYKNALIFIPLLFAGKFFVLNLFLLTLVGFLSLCLVSSSYYIINDLKDVKKDRHHPEKRHRPIAAGKISKGSSIFISLILLTTSLLIAYFLSIYFLFMVLGLFFISQLYTFSFRNFIFLDIIFISLNFVIRAISGVFLIDVPVSYWIILSTFFLSIFLVGGKRIVELDLKDIGKYRSNYKKDNKKSLEFMVITSSTIIIIFFSIYSILNEKTALLFSLPVALYLLLEYFDGIYNSPEKIRNPEKFIFSKKPFISLIIWIILIIFALYVLI